MMKTALYLLILLFWLSPLSANELKGHYSPYLAMHGDDPVNWMEWGQVALDKAKKENKPIFISSGYFACHWCHVMHRESFKNAEVAELLNTHYVPVKIDREINAVLDERLIHYVRITTGTAGWPLNVFMTPDAYPMVGTGYVPPKDFKIALQRLQTLWKDDQKKLISDAKTTHDKIVSKDQSNQKAGKKAHIRDNLEALKQASLEHGNDMQGGFGEQNQFPREPALLALLRLTQIKQDQDIDDFLILTLDNIQSQGLHDHIGGGFYRYTVDPAWETPHFEKMLYNNAMLAQLFSLAAKHYQRSDYAATAKSTLNFMREAMQAKSGAYYGSLSALDDKDVEGGFYLWKQSELQKILSPEEIELANKAWGMDQTSILEAGVLPRIQGKDIDAEKLTAIKNKLKDWRNKNRKLPKDTKLLASWNGLALAAFAQQYQEQSNQQAGKQLASFLEHLFDGKQLRRSQNSPRIGELNDYASVAYGLMHWAKASGNSAVLKTATEITQLAWQKFYSDKGWKQTEKTLLPTPIYQQHIQDSALPSPETLLLEASLLSGNTKLQNKAKQVLQQSTEALEDKPFFYGSLITLSARDLANAK